MKKYPKQKIMSHINGNICLLNSLVSTSYWFGMPSVDPKEASEGKNFRAKKLGVGIKRLD